MHQARHHIMLKSGKKKSMALTTILSIIIPGVGHIYVGKIKLGLVVLGIGLAGDIISQIFLGSVIPEGDIGVLSQDMTVLGIFLGISVGFLAFYIWQIINARKECRICNSITMS